MGHSTQTCAGHIGFGQVRRINVVVPPWRRGLQPCACFALAVSSLLLAQAVSATESAGNASTASPAAAPVIASSVSSATGTALPPPRIREGVARNPGLRSNRSLLPPWDTKRVGIVLAMFAGLMGVQRLLTPRAKPNLPASAVQVCGKVPLDAKQFVHLVKIGERLLVLLESPQGMQRLAEITDPAEVQSLLAPGPNQYAITPNLTSAPQRMPDDGASPEVRHMLAQFRQPRGVRV